MTMRVKKPAQSAYEHLSSVRDALSNKIGATQKALQEHGYLNIHTIIAIHRTTVEAWGEGVFAAHDYWGRREIRAACAKLCDPMGFIPGHSDFGPGHNYDQDCEELRQSAAKTWAEHDAFVRDEESRQNDLH